jgi:UDP-N-acetylmuramoylalanine--D-glutamate ligase
MKKRKHNYVIYGSKITGSFCLKFLANQGENVFICDDDSSNIENDMLKYFKDFDIITKDYNFVPDFIIPSPGIRPTHKIHKYAKDKNIKIISDIDLLYKISNGGKKNRFIGITGTNGKSTVTSMISHVLNENNLESSAIGNIGISPFERKINNKEIYSIEISSFQLDITSTNFDISLILNITPDHLDRYSTMENYIKSKERILRGNGVKILGIDCKNTLKLYEKHKNISNIIGFSSRQKVQNGYYSDGKVIYYNDNKIYDLPKKINGDHIINNSLAVMIVCL